jgi:hypothetical protein
MFTKFKVLASTGLERLINKIFDHVQQQQPKTYKLITLIFSLLLLSFTSPLLINMSLNPFSRCFQKSSKSKLLQVARIRPQFERSRITCNRYRRHPDTSYSIDARKELGTHGLSPPNVESHALQAQRCMALGCLLRAFLLLIIF